MAITIVNGFVCTSGCDEARARQNIDPNAPPGTPPGEERAPSGLDTRPATLLDGRLRAVAGTAEAAIAGDPPPRGLDLVV